MSSGGAWGVDAFAVARLGALAGRQLSGLACGPAAAQETDDDDIIEEIVVTGTRATIQWVSSATSATPA